MDSGDVVIYAAENASAVAGFLEENVCAFTAPGSAPPQRRSFSELANSETESASLMLLALSPAQGPLGEDDALKAYATLKPNGSLVAAATGADADGALEALGLSCIFAGFLSEDIASAAPAVAAAAREQQIRMKLWRRPTWARGAATSLTGVDEDSLIGADDKYTPMGQGRSGCAARAKACANCTCGRKEAEEAEDRQRRREMLESGKVTSSCGNCYLGDAFRCEGCPYKGLPAFQPGEKVKLPGEKNFASVSTEQTHLTKGGAGEKVTLASLDDD